jgi:hypothetical protein
MRHKKSILSQYKKERFLLVKKKNPHHTTGSPVPADPCMTDFYHEEDERCPDAGPAT